MKLLDYDFILYSRKPKTFTFFYHFEFGKNL